MALVTHHMRGSNITVPSRSLAWNKQTDLRRFVTVLHNSVNKDRFLSLRCKSCFNIIGAPLIRVSRSKALRISAFKGGARDDESIGRASGSSSSKSSVKLSYVQKGSEEMLTESTKVQDVSLSYVSESDETVSRSLAIQNLFKSWLTLLRSQPPKQVVDEASGEPDTENTLVIEDEKQKSGRGEIMKAVWCYFWGLDATVKIPLLVFIPLYLAINVKYGAEVSKELTPLWVFGPLVAALYVKMLQLLCALYVYSFKQTVQLVKNSPTYSSVAYHYIASGKLKEVLSAHLPGSKNMTFKDFLNKMKKDFQEWVTEKYLDFVESIWPTYCRTIRFLKRANLI